MASKMKRRRGGNQPSQRSATHAGEARQMPRPGRGEPQYNARLNFKLTPQGRQQLRAQAKAANFGGNTSGYLRSLLTKDRGNLGMRKRFTY